MSDATENQHVVVIGAGIVGVSAGIWLRRAGVQVTLIDRAKPGQGTSYGNAGVLASCSIVPVTTPGLLKKAPGYLLNPDFPLFLRWRYLPKLAPWLGKYLSHANDRDTRRIARGLNDVVGDSVEQHLALSRGTKAEAFIKTGEYRFAYKDRQAFQADSYVWSIREEAGFVPKIIEGEQVRETDPAFGPNIQCLACVKDHGHITDPGAYVAALADELVESGGRFVKAAAQDFEISEGAITAVLTDQGRFSCDQALIATGVWSKPLMAKLGLNVPLETERGYHIVFKEPSIQPNAPTMIASGKFVATPMAEGLRCAGVVEFGGLDAGPSRPPFDLLRRQVQSAFPGLTASEEIEWQGHRPAPSDSLPLIGETQASGLYTAFGHHHIGLTGGPKSGRLVADLMSGRTPNSDLSIFSPLRFS